MIFFSFDKEHTHKKLPTWRLSGRLKPIWRDCEATFSFSVLFILCYVSSVLLCLLCVCVCLLFFFFCCFFLFFIFFFFFFFFVLFFPCHYENMPIQIYWIFYHQNMKIFRWKILIIFIFLLENIDCGYSLEPPQRGGSNEPHNICFRGGSNESPQSMFSSKMRKIMYTPVNSSFTI